MFLSFCLDCEMNGESQRLRRLPTRHDDPDEGIIKKRAMMESVVI